MAQKEWPRKTRKGRKGFIFAFFVLFVANLNWSDVVLVCLHDVLEVFVLVRGPEARAEDFDFVEALEAGGFHPGADLAERDAAFAHEAPVEEEIGGGCTPVADVISEERVEAATTGDLGFERGVPPEVIDIGGDADVRRLE